jgi:hypothetical protein
MDHSVGNLEWNRNFGQMRAVWNGIRAGKTIARNLDDDLGMDLRLPSFGAACSHGYHSCNIEWSCLLGSR